MGKNHRHKKQVKSEKAKVKLKQTKTKFLPKGLNVTKTDFKIKPIVLPEQLKEKDTEGLLSKRKLNIQDLLSRMKHYNENVRLHACEELSEMFKIHWADIINQHLAKIILTVSTMMQDKIRKVRKAAIKVVSGLLKITPQEKLQPFFNYFTTNMCCAMTNINRSIQEDSLLFLDCFLEHNSELVSKTSDKLLPNFFTLISTLRSDSNLERTLTVIIGTKTSSVTWRIKVLSRLHKVLELILCNYVEDIDITESNTYTADACSTFPINKEVFVKSLSSSISNSFGTSRNSLNSRAEFLHKYIITLVPLLYETWIEVVPEKKIGKAIAESTVLSEEAAEILSCIMDTLYLLWKYVKQKENNAIKINSVFLSVEGKKFLNHLLLNFPYCRQDSGLKILKVNPDRKCFRENILICFMYCVLSEHLQVKLRIEMEAITTYIGNSLANRKNIDQRAGQFLIEFINFCLLKSSDLWKRAGVNLELILKGAVHFYDNVNEDTYKMQIFNILANVADTRYLNKNVNYNGWLSSLPNLLCRPKITDVLVDALLKLSRKNNRVFHMSLLDNFLNILENLDCLNIVITNPSLVHDEEIVKKNITNIFFFVPTLHQEHLDEIGNFMKKRPHSKYCQYFSDMLQLRSEFKKDH